MSFLEIQQAAEEAKKNEFFGTPRALCEAICVKLAGLVEEPRLIVEPSAGDGAFCGAARRVWHRAPIHAVEVRESTRSAIYRAVEGAPLEAGPTTVEIGRWEDSKIDLGNQAVLILGNPPFSLAESHVAIALKRLAERDGKYPGIPPRGILCFLLKSSFMSLRRNWDDFFGPKGVGGLRWKWDLVGRPSFDGGGAGTDRYDYSVFIWDVGYVGEPMGGWLLWDSASDKQEILCS